MRHKPANKYLDRRLRQTRIATEGGKAEEALAGGVNFLSTGLVSELRGPMAGWRDGGDCRHAVNRARRGSLGLYAHLQPRLDGVGCVCVCCFVRGARLRASSWGKSSLQNMLWQVTCY